MPQATLTSPSLPCGSLLYRSSVAPLDFHVDVILMHIAQLCATFPLTLRRYERLVHPRTTHARVRRALLLHLDAEFLLFPQPINFLSLLHPAFVVRIIKSADQQVAVPEERVRIVDAICARGGEMMLHRGRRVNLATNCYGYRVLQRAFDCEEEEAGLLIVSELLRGDPATTLVNKPASHLWNHGALMDPPAPPIFGVNKSLKGKWAAFACYEIGSLVVRHAFESLEESAKDGIVDEILGQGTAVFGEVAKSQWGLYCIQHIPEHGLEKHRQMALEHLLTGLLGFTTKEQGRAARRMCKPAKGYVVLPSFLSFSRLSLPLCPSCDDSRSRTLAHEEPADRLCPSYGMPPFT
ncbi:hypothetical protein C8J57DRAFT_1527839 [Mycena rebaudengoi]|nr:hypothetical protein C8J57DRAFT_1527839 [Mycena rebaudengoi]